MPPRDTHQQPERTGMSDAHMRPELKARNPLHERAAPASTEFGHANAPQNATVNTHKKPSRKRHAPASHPALRPDGDTARAADWETHMQSWKDERKAAHQDFVRARTHGQTVEAQSLQSREAFTRARQMHVPNISRARGR